MPIAYERCFPVARGKLLLQDAWCKTQDSAKLGLGFYLRFRLPFDLSGRHNLTHLGEREGHRPSCRVARMAQHSGGSLERT
jgi:hypothetical protein